VLGAGAALAFAAGIYAGASGPSGSDETAVAGDDATELPRGGRSLLPEYRMVGFYGAPGDAALGTLGIGPPSEATGRLLEQARAYSGNRPVLPVLELIAVTAASAPGDDGLYRIRQPHSVIRRYLKAAREARALLLLDIQPGRADFVDEVKRLERYLREPDVGLALDPEWRVSEGEVPGDVIGQVDSREVNATSAWLAQLVERRNLPEKLFVIHQFTDDMVDDTELKQRDGLAMVLNVDGFGGREVKIAKYRNFARDAPDFIPGFKLFYEEDLNLLAPRDVMRMKPRPQLVVYE
jgi:hypothetical protein